MNECPTCDREFDTLLGVKSHHVQAHGESIAGCPTACDNCGEQYRAQYANVERSENNFCSKDCQGEWQAEKWDGEDHHLYNRVTVACDTCGADVEKKPSEAKRNSRHFCDKECYATWQTTQTGPKHPAWDGGPTIQVCHNCGQFIEREQSHAERHDKSFCSTRCFEEWATENHAGENNPSWAGGHEKYYGPSWRRQRRNAIARSGGQCELCGMSRDSHRNLCGQDLHVHHKIPYRVFDDDHEANKLDNLIVVCRSCHCQIEPVSAANASKKLNEGDADA